MCSIALGPGIRWGDEHPTALEDLRADEEGRDVRVAGVGVDEEAVVQQEGRVLAEVLAGVVIVDELDCVT